MVCNNEEECSKFINNDMSLPDGLNRSLDQEAEVVTLHLSKLPLDLPLSILEKDLQEIFSHYSQVVDIFLLTEIYGGFFLGTVWYP
jgi:hypothetical protein